MRILFVLGDTVYFRFVDGVVRELARDGADVTVLSNGPPSVAIQRCLQAWPNLRYGRLRQVTGPIGRGIRFLRDFCSYVHWLAPERRWSPFLRRRWLRLFPAPLRDLIRLVGVPRFEALLGRLPWLASFLKWAEARVPCESTVLRSLSRLAPDVVVGMPVIFPGSHELEYLKAAQQLGIATVVQVASWDNLSMKGTFHLDPDAVLVWNEIQRDEASRLHGLDPAKVHVTGAPSFDEWFTPHYRIDRTAFCRRAGLDPERPYCIYLESSNASGDERPLIAALAHRLTATGVSSRLQLLVRPHPKKANRWDHFAFKDVVVWPRGGVFADLFETRQDYYNSLAHACAAVGVNTSAFIEATILDRPCISLTVDRHRYFQEELLHFHYLLDAGFLYTASDAAGCVALLDRLLAGEDDRQSARRAFVESFVRPIPPGQTGARTVADSLWRVLERHRARLPLAA